MLITASKIKEIRAISDNIKESKRIEPFILEAEQTDLMDLLGNALYTDLLDKVNDSPSIYDTLLNGGTYTYKGIKYTIKGLGYALAYFAYSRFLKFQGVNITNFGIVQKTTEFSQPVSGADINRMASSAKDIAMSYFSDCKLYLDRNSDTFSLWEFIEVNKSSIRVTAI